MKFYIAIYKIWKFCFWIILLPGVMLLISLPLLLKVLYNLETNINSGIVNSQSELNIKGVKQASLDSSNYATKKALVMGISTSVTDYRSIVLDEFFKRNNSVLYGSGKDFVASCDKYNAPFDCTTLPAIGFVETRLCDTISAKAQYNCWGFGGSGKNRITFKSFADAIDTITGRLVNAYGTKYMLNPKLMQSTYCGPNCTTWGDGVQTTRYQINTLAQQMGFPALIK